MLVGTDCRSVVFCLTVYWCVYVFLSVWFEWEGAKVHDLQRNTKQMRCNAIFLEMSQSVGYSSVFSSDYCGFVHPSVLWTYRIIIIIVLHQTYHGEMRGSGLWASDLQGNTIWNKFPYLGDELYSVSLGQYIRYNFFVHLTDRFNLHFSHFY